jgi:zinc transporter, ZIP family
VTAAAVGVVALGTALATGLGALPFVGHGRGSARWLGPADAVAAGVMFAATAALVLEAVERGAVRTLAGVLAGVAFVVVARRWLAHRRTADIGSLHGADARRGVILVAVMTVHSFAEGAGVGAAFGGGAAFGLVIALAIAIHNIPEGLAISLVLVPHGVRARTAAGWSVVSSLPQPLVAVPAYLFVEAFATVLPLALGFAAGAMAWIAGRELIPAALEGASRRSVAVAATAAFVPMLALQLLLLT